MPLPHVTSLDGTWRAAPADDAPARLALTDGAVDDDGWEAVAVPGHWRSAPALADHDGPVLYRTRFELDPPDEEDLAGVAQPSRSFLELDGVLAASDVWLDGAYLGDTSGYVVPHAFEVTDLVGARREHVLGVEVSCSPVGPGATRDLTGALGRSALLADGHGPGGIWRSVRVKRTGPVRVRFSRLRCTEADHRRATLALRAVLDTREARTVTLRTTVRLAVAADGTHLASGGDGLVVERDHPLATGENRVEWTVPVEAPQLWWPRALGGRPRYDVTLEVVVDGGVSDVRTWRTGLRQVRMRDFRLRVNDEPLFLKGASIGPTRELLAEATPEEVAADITLAVDTGLDLLRVHGHVGRPELYEAADDAGVLLWQDLPLQWSLQRQAKRRARRVARASVDQLAHHPSVAIWCAHHEPFDGDPRTWRAGGDDALPRRRRREARAQVLPSWNRTVLDRSIAAVLHTSDGSRPVVAHSGVWPHLPQLSGTSTHLWAGWRWGGIGSLERLLRWWPRLGRFVAEFGAQAPGADGLGLPAGIADAPPRIWNADAWRDLAHRRALEVPAAVRAVPPDRHTPDSWADALRAHQAEVVRSHVEVLRRLKGRPVGGFAAFALTEPAPGITAALVDHARRPKPALAALREACAPVLAVVDRPADHLRAGDHLHLEVHVVNDLRAPGDDLVVRLDATWRAGAGPDAAELSTTRRGWAGEVGADDVARVGTAHLDVPLDARWATLTLTLHRGSSLLGRRTHERPVHAPPA